MKGLLDKHLFVSFDFRLLEPGGGIREFFYRHLRASLSKDKYYNALVSSELRKIYAPEIRELTAGPLAALQRVNPKAYEEKIAEALMQYFGDTENQVPRALRYMATKKGVRCVFLLDNVDQLRFEVQEDILPSRIRYRKDARRSRYSRCGRRLIFDLRGAAFCQLISAGSILCRRSASSTFSVDD
jgi:hypothetical protein